MSLLGNLANETHRMGNYKLNYTESLKLWREVNFENSVPLSNYATIKFNSNFKQRQILTESFKKIYSSHIRIHAQHVYAMS